ncbi:MAG: DnaJ domain-containing protein [Syntrophobacteraceae bacterium]|nr:DnaJ domain-containing protein [Syntrophobacteraceae bacterium]
MTGPDRLTSIVNAYVQSSRIVYKSRGAAGPSDDRVQISSEGLQKSKEFLAQVNDQIYSKEYVSTSQEDVSTSRPAGDNLEILNLSSSASLDQIHRAYVSAIKQYHPDNFNRYSPEFKKLAEEKSKQIIRAYENLTKFSYRSA